MNDNLVSVNHGQIVTNSRQVAVHFEKQHQHVIRDIENIVDKAEEKDASKIGRMFFETTMPDAYGRMKRVYLMNRDGFSLLVMGFTGCTFPKYSTETASFHRFFEALRSYMFVLGCGQRSEMLLEAIRRYSMVYRITLVVSGTYIPD